MSKKPRLSIHELRQFIAYEPSSGSFRWVKRFDTRTPGIATGIISSNGYILFSIKGRCYSAHRLAVAFQTDAWPAGDVDHIDGDRKNNKWDNLRSIDRQGNIQNQRTAPKHNRYSGLLGAHYVKETGKFRARIKCNGVKINLGTFETPEEAHAAYVRAKRLIHVKGNTL